MKPTAAMKSWAMRAGLYRPARALYRGVWDRGQKRRLEADAAFFRNLLGPPCLCFDVGANIGEKSEALLRAGATVVAFEPQPDCYDELVARCGGSPRFTARRLAVGAEPGRAELFVRRHRGASGLVGGWDGEVERTVEVGVTTLDLAADEFGVPRYCKIDVEGWEGEVLRGLSRPVELVSFEYHLTEPGVEAARACLARLRDLGGRVAAATPAERLEPLDGRWLPLDAFLDGFPSAYVGRDGWFYGDIFVRSSAGA